MPRLSKIGAAALAAFGWTGLQSVTASYLVVAGGGSGGGFGGGGAGGYQTGTTSLNPTLSYTITVGGGGTGVLNPNAGGDGSNSVFNSITSIGGGGGGSFSATLQNGRTGGSGGGGGTSSTSPYTAGSVGAGTSGQGNNGGLGVTGATAGGGGGGSTATGFAGSGSTGGAGGTGTTSSISGTSVLYAEGGGGGGSTGGTTAGTGGAGGTNNSNPGGFAGSANKGGGGGGSYANTTYASGNGGSGIVIISYPAPQQFGGGVVTTSGSNVIHTFNTSGTLTPLSSLTASYLIVAGGGGGGEAGGGGGGGGGAGGLLSGTGLTIDTNSNYVVTVGSGGAGSIIYTARGSSGTNSSFSMVTTSAVGGGAGGSYPSNQNGLTGGSGGGGGGNASAGTGGAGTSGQGNTGGNGGTTSAVLGGGGGGGASAVGSNATTTAGGNGGAGTANPITGSTTGQLVSSTYYLAGGGGGGAGSSATSQATGGNGGGGNGALRNGSVTGTAGTANTGGGGGGGWDDVPSSFNGTAQAGGSGVVIISYAGSTQQMAGGTVTITGGNVIHTFTSSGYLTPIKYVNNSLRFRSSASAYLNRTSGSPTSGSIFTHSFWVKRGILGAGTTLIAGARPTNFDRIVFNSTDTLLYQWNDGTSNLAYVETTQVFRDPAAWYHIVVATDTTQATASNRVKIYINGVLVTALTSTTYPSQNSTSYFNINAGTLNLGRSTNASAYLDGYLTEINFIDGQALTPTSFGTTNSYGVWQPITYGGSYGTNGFYLPFTGSSTSTYAASFNGSSQYLYLGGQSNFAFGTGDFTVEMWVNNNSFSVAPVYYDGRPPSTNGAYPTIYAISGSLRYFTNGGDAITSYTVMSTGVWYHAAVVRSGTTTTLYLNGVSQGTYSDSQNYLNGASVRPCIGISNGGLNLFNGYMSNLRVVKGTAVYTANFTPPTSPLTAITNTQLLTLQNATIVDNSTNAFTITNVGTTATATQYPFNVSLFNDKSSAGNNWTPNNISLVNGATYDSMTDVPTLTSATAANYAVLNPLITDPSYPPSSGNLINAVLNNQRANVSTIALPSTGTYVCEMSPYTSSVDICMGICLVTTRTQGSTSTVAAGAVGDYLYYQANGNKISSAGSVAYGSALAVGDILGIVVDTGAGTITFYKNGTSLGQAYSGLSGTFVFCAVGATAGTNSSVSANFGQRPFSYTYGSAVALNTYNM